MRLSIIIIALFWFGQTFGQINASTHPKTKLQELTTPESTLQWMTLKKEVSITPDELVTDKNLLELSTDDKLSKISTTTDELGYEHRRYLQHYKGIPIENAWYFVHAKNGKTQTANGRLAKGLRLDVRSVITQENALDRIVDSSKSQKYAWMDARVEENFKKTANDPKATFYPEGELLITRKRGANSEKDYVLAYRFEVFSLEPYQVEAVYVDAKNGKIIKKTSLLHEAHECTAHADTNVPATGVSNHSGTVQFTTEPSGNQYHLKNHVGRTYNAENTKDYPFTDFLDADNHWTDDPMAVDVHWGMEKAYDYFLSKYNRNSYDDNGSPMSAWVHFGTNSTLAGWNGACSCLIFGDGDDEDFSSMTSLDVVAHEYTHGVTSYSSGLEYEGESGALNESFSDIFGSLIEQQYHPNGGNWVIGDEIVTTPGKQGLRNLADPKDPNMKTQQPDTYMGEYWYSGQKYRKGIHINGGVHNHWFYLLAHGGSGVNDNGDYYKVEGIGVQKAAQIVYRNFTTYLQPNATYYDAVSGSMNAVNDLFGASPETTQTYKAWCAVGLGGNNCVNFTPPGRIRDSLALVALYNSTQGSTWKYRWNLNRPTSTWKGVTVNAEGCVTRLNLPSNNRLNGTLPPEIGNLLDLEYLKIHNNADLVGNIPPEFGNLTKLVDVFLYYNNLSGNLPKEIGNLSSIRQLMLDGNRLTGNLPASIKNLPNTAFLTFSNNQLENLPNLSDLPATYKIYVRGNKLTFEDIILNRNVLVASNQYKPQRKIGETKTVQLTPDESYTIKLNIDTYVADNVYKWYKDGVLVGTTNKDEFTISDFTNAKAGVYTCQVTNSLASSLTLESYPVTVQVSPISCRLRDSLVLVDFYQATGGDQARYACCEWDLDQPMNQWRGITLNADGCVIKIHLSAGGIKGSIPPSIGDLVSLEHLTIEHTNLSGTSIPTEIGKLTNLTWLELDRNQLSGSIPPGIGSLVNLEYLDLGRNNLTGSIPPEIGNLTNVRWLSFYYNQLTGKIPVELSNLASINVLVLSENRLSDLPPMSHLSPNHVAFNNNFLTFKDILPNLGIMEYNQAGGSKGGSYKNQRKIGEATTSVISSGDEIYINLDIDHDITDNVYKWYKDGNLIQTIIGDPTFSKTVQSANDAGVYTCRVTNPGESYLTLHSEPYTMEFEEATEVYPGDFNNDGIVDEADPLFWGLNYGRTGIPRSEASLQWTGQPCLNWNVSHHGVNGKHQDGNGDGIVDEADLEAVNQNYGKITDTTNIDYNPSPLSLRWEVSSEADGRQTVHTIDVFLENLDYAPIAVHGLSFGFDFTSNSMNYLHSDIDLSESQLGSSEDSLTVIERETINQDGARVEFTITRNDLRDMTIITSEPVIKLVIVSDDLETGDEQNFALAPNNMKVASASTGQIMDLNTAGQGVSLRNEAAVSIENIYPNPTRATQGITLMLNTDTDYGEGYINVTDILGKSLIQQPVNLKQGKQELHVLTDRLPSGIYTVHLRGSSWHSHAQQFIIRNE